ncbi:MAG: GNAT family N-acetyltransferase [Planctomycetaceae bacterium]
MLPMKTVAIRAETSADYSGVRTVHERAFGRTTEANLVDALRAAGAAVISLLAERDGQVVGHICFSPVVLEPERPDVRGLGLGPLAVLPEFQRQGIGSALVRSGLAACRELRHDFVVVLGHPGYYPAFGFVPAGARAWRCEFEAPEEAFMVIDLQAGELCKQAAIVRYRPEFRNC